MRRRNLLFLPSCLALITMGLGIVPPAARAQEHPTAAARASRVTTPKTFFGHEIGADYVLPNYRQLVDYWKRLERESDRMRLVDLGKTEEGRSQYMAVVTAPENFRKLERYREISRKLARAEDLSDAEARALSGEGKAVVWIDGGLHATEVLGAQQLMETVYQLVSRSDPETLRILNDVIVLAVHANPDGHDLVSDWYMRSAEPMKRSYANLPRLYQKYVGHDNNRDFYAATQAETKNMCRVLFRDWIPQIVYNHHQTGPAGTVMFAPPFRDPFNYFIDPLIISSLDLVGAAMHQRFIAEDKPGVTMRHGANYSTWWNGGLRTTVYFHNQIGLLTETIGGPNPMQIPFLPHRQLPHGDLPFPIPPQRWHFRQSVDYSVTANYAVLDLASRHRETLLYNIYRMGRNSIERGSRDHWTLTPKKIERAQTAMRPLDRLPNAAESAQYLALVRDPALRDPRGYILPADQPDFPTATKFVNMLIENGVTVLRASRDFELHGKTYPKHSYVIRTSQAFRPHILDMFEPQEHPHDFQYPGGPPVPPYDSAGWTLALQMGVQFDRILDGFEGPFERISGPVKTPAGRVVRGNERPAGYLLSHAANDSFRALNRLLKEGEEVYWLTQPLEVNGNSHAPGTFFIPEKNATGRKLARLAEELGLSFEAVSAAPKEEAFRVRPQRIALWDRYGGSMPSGWVRWLLEQFEFPFEVVYPQTLDAGNLRQKYDVILFVTGAIPERDARAASFPNPAGIPSEYHSWLGRVTVAGTVPKLKQFLEAGGTVLTIGSSTVLARHLGLPVTDALTTADANGRERKLNPAEYYVPGSILQTRVDIRHPLAHGLPERLDVFFDNSPVFRLAPNAESQGVRRVAWFDSEEPLRSGWAWGQDRLKDGASIIEAEVGKGRLVLFGPEITFRAQPHGTFKLLFNGLYYGDHGNAERAALK